MQDFRNGGRNCWNPRGYTRKGVRAGQVEEPDVAAYLNVMGERLEALLEKIKEDRELRKQWVVNSQPDAGNGMPYLPLEGTLSEGVSDHQSRRCHSRHRP